MPGARVFGQDAFDFSDRTWCLGRVSPDFFEQIFARSNAELDAAEFGFGIGLTNGLLWGLVVGVALVAIFAWKGDAAGAHGSGAEVADGDRTDR